MSLAIGIDIGGTKIAAGLVRRSDGAILHREQIATRAERGGEAVLGEVLALASRLVAVAPDGDLPDGIGIGICELVDAGGEIASHGTIDWRGLGARARLQSIAPVRFESDARAPAIAEARFGAGHPFGSFLYLTLGTGISSCLVKSGEPWRGARGNALVSGSGLLGEACAECGAVQQQSLEQRAAGPAILARYNARATRRASHGADISAAALRGEALAIEVLTAAAGDIAGMLALLVNALDPAAVVLGGGLGLAGGVFLERLVAATRAGIWAESTRALPIVPAALGSDASVIGAALCAP